MIAVFSVLNQGVKTLVHFFKTDSETITSDREDITCDIN